MLVRAGESVAEAENYVLSNYVLSPVELRAEFEQFSSGTVIRRALRIACNLASLSCTVSTQPLETL